MSVLKSKRHISTFEYENTFTILYQFSAEQTSKVPLRKQKWLCAKIDEIMNNSYELIMELNECYFSKEKEINSEEIINKTIDLLLQLEKPLLILWSVQRYRTKTMITWSDLLCKELDLLSKMAGKNKKHRIKILDYQTINRVSFLRNMSDFQLFLYGKVIKAPMKYDSTAGTLLLRLADDAFFYLIEANKKIPENKKELEYREKCISAAISNLRKMQRQTLFYCNLMKYSETVLREWSDYLTTELKLLNALKKSDAKRFEHLM